MKNKILVIVLVLMVAVVAASGCAAKDPLVGKWELDDDSDIVNLEFASNGDLIHDEYSSDGTWLRTKYKYEYKDNELVLKEGRLLLDNEYTEPTDEKQKINCGLNGDALVLDGKYEYTHVDEFTNTYEADKN